MKVNVHVRDQMFSIYCGSGSQKVRWLSDVALHRYEHFFGVDPGLAKGMRYENGTIIDMETTIISDKLENEIHVWVILKEDLALMESEQLQREQQKQKEMGEVENLYLVISNHASKNQIQEITNLLTNQNKGINYLVEQFLQLPETPKPNLKAKLAYSKIIIKLSEIPTFKSQLYDYVLSLIKSETITAWKSQDLHKFTITLIQQMFSQPSSLQFVLEHQLDIFQSITILMHHDDSGISQKALQTFLLLINSISKENEDYILQSKEQIKQLLVEGVQDTNTVIQVRYFELAVNLSLISQQLCDISEQAIQIVFDRFFAQDPLTQMATMDFIILLSQKPQTRILISKTQFLTKMFEHFSNNDTYGVISNNLVNLGAHVYQSNPEIFNALKNPSYLWFFNRLINSKDTKDLETACTCMYFFFKRKESLVEHFVNNIDQLQKYIQCAKTNEDDLKRAFLVSLKELLKLKNEEDREKYNEIVRRIFSNITTPQNFPNMGQENNSINYLITNTNVPFGQMELLGLKVLKQLINWEWGMRSLYQNSNAVSYILSRQQKSKDICEKKFRLVEKTLNSKFFFKTAGVIDPVIGGQLEVYYQGGIYGTVGGPNFVPEYASKIIIAVVAYLIYYLTLWKNCQPRFDGKTIFITGGSSGIGEQLCKRFVQLGAKNVVITARRVAELERVKNECVDPSKVIALQMDQADPQKVLEIAQNFNLTQTIDILINNGGMSMRELFENTDFATCINMMNVNCMSHVALTKGILPRMIAQKSGQIVNILSISGLMGVPIRTLYCAPKFAMDGFSKALEPEVRKHGIKVTQIYPAYVHTNISMNAATGSGKAFGMTDENIKAGISVEVAVDNILKAIYLKRSQYICGSWFYYLMPRLAFLSETLNDFIQGQSSKRQMRVLNASKKEK